MTVLRRPITVWPKVYANPYAGVDDDIARAQLADDRDRFWSAMAIGVENRIWCEALHRGRWPS